MPEDQVRRAVAGRLRGELDDEGVSSAVASMLDERAVRVLGAEEDLDTTELLHFDAPVQSSPEALVVFAFGNRIDDVGEVSAGPVNVELASLADEWARRTGSPVVAQWEVADEMRTTAHRVGAVRHADGSVEYLSTVGVVEQALAILSVRVVGVLAMADHAGRCCRVLDQAGFCAGVPAEIDLPTRYDAASGQPWTRDRAAYVAVDILARCLQR